MGLVAGAVAAAAAMPVAVCVLVGLPGPAACAVGRWRLRVANRDARTEGCAAFSWLLAGAMEAEAPACAEGGSDMPASAAVPTPEASQTPDLVADAGRPVLEQGGDFWRVGYGSSSARSAP